MRSSATARVLSKRSLWERPFASNMRHAQFSAAYTAAASASSLAAGFAPGSYSIHQTSRYNTIDSRLFLHGYCSMRRIKVHAAAAADNDQEVMEHKSLSNADADTTTASDYATTYHAPVMAKECIDALLGIGFNGEGKKKTKKKQRKMRKKDRKRMDETTSQEQNEAKSSISPDDMKADSLPADRPPMLFVDGTLGGGGHSAALLERLLPGDVVFGCDVDPSALSAASERLHRFTAGNNEEESSCLPLFVPVQSNFRDLADILPTVRHPVTGKRIMKLPLEVQDVDSDTDTGTDTADLGEHTFVGVDGMLLDLGVSSHQINTADRGFAFMKEGPLDMRMWGGSWSSIGSDSVAQNTAAGARGINAADICNEFDEAELTRIFRVYGDEPRARKISSAIVNARPLTTTSDLFEAVSSVVPEFAKKGRRMGRTATLARIFQSLRIVVNEEDEALVDVFEHAAPTLIRPGGRLVVLSYHSMEDRATKRIMRDGSVRGTRDGSAIDKDIYGNVVGPKRPWRPLGKKRKASEEEVEVNSRARSATLRVGKRQ